MFVLVTTAVSGLDCNPQQQCELGGWDTILLQDTKRIHTHTYSHTYTQYFTTTDT